MEKVYNITELKIDRNFRAFIDFLSLELEVPTICLVTGGVSVRRDRRYNGIYSLETQKSCQSEQLSARYASIPKA